MNAVAQTKLIVDKVFLTWSQSFLFLSAIILVVVLPESTEISRASSAPGMASFFPYLSVVLIAIYAINFGQTQADPGRPWRYHFGMKLWPHAFQLSIRLSLLLLLSLPLWLIFYDLFHLPWSSAIALLYLWLQAQMWGWFGLWLNLSGMAEINQFKIKYLILLGFFILTLTVPMLSPFVILEQLLSPQMFAGAWYHFLVGIGFTLLWIIVLGWMILRRARKKEASQQTAAIQVETPPEETDSSESSDVG